ncbi:MAG: nitroreductase family protein [Candidatus Hydrogenedentes bacterium]|nr:nitroreductase family protein [Candidatus Hydrogenedentota bacterium]
MDTIEALRTRRSIRQYIDKEVPKELLETMVDCGRLAATARNEQPWEFIVVTDKILKQKIAEATDHGKFIKDAGACIVVVCKDTKYYLEDGSAATQNILVAGRALGLGTCWVAGDKKPYCDNILRILNVPPGYKLTSLIAVGYPASTPNPPKRPLNEVLHWNGF